MITGQYCRTMAQYNQWQNNGLRNLIKAMDEEELRLDRGAFFGSIFGTLNHVLWADILWLSRFGAGDPPDVPAAQHRDMTPNKAEWDRLRFITDGRINTWAAGLKEVDLTGDLEWYSTMLDKTMRDPKTLCAVHFFNHQTHHRGQIHAMMTAAGQTPIDTDLSLMAE
ncbi:DinB family protein [Pseudooctadecabacter jejudonensis]|uniref:DinB family protein n=1 Tax=Pseudooctadecabacter jejudonensis TaxID=1391910 RepID=A0A1Y5RCF7_9RHOB|nr:DinB family protein [Pseudooctadecabacter jejudonensis]SLN14171.1 DinB family protein [Pseudooctadecabacter jejudonensis]